MLSERNKKLAEIKINCLVKMLRKKSSPLLHLVPPFRPPGLGLSPPENKSPSAGPIITIKGSAFER
jgi:hypothetical protein